MEQGSNKGNLLLRLVNPDWDQDGVPSSQAFRPMNDNLTVSFYDATKITPEEAYFHFTEELENRAVYVVSVPVQVLLAEGLEVDFNGEPYPSHVNVDYSNFSSNKRVRIQKNQGACHYSLQTLIHRNPIA